MNPSLRSFLTVASLLSESHLDDKKVLASAASRVEVGLPAAMDASEQRWQQFLTNLRDSQTVTAAQVTSARRVWCAIRQEVDGASPPQTTVAPSGSLYLVWQTESHLAEIEIMESGKLEWFMRNRKTGVFSGSDDHELSDLPPEFLSAAPELFVS